MSAATALPDVPLPLSQDQAAVLEGLASSLDQAGLWWLSGYAAGLAAGRLTSAAIAAPAASPVLTTVATGSSQRLTIVYASQTGNARRVAEQLERQASEAGLAARLLRADAYSVRDLKQEQLLYIVASTQGDGDPSDDAQDLFAQLESKRAPRLEQLEYAVLALGDSSYPRFCEIGRRLDARLHSLGARRLLDVAEADLDIERIAAPWRQQALHEASQRLAEPAPRPAATVTPLRGNSALQARPRQQPVNAQVIANQRLTLGAHKQVHHLELDIAGSGLSYQPGDAVAIVPRNAEQIVAQVLEASGLDGESSVTHEGETLPLAQWLGERRELTRLARPFLAAHAQRNGSTAMARLLQADSQSALSDVLRTRQVVDLMREHPADWDAQALVAALRPLAPRLYSISSSSTHVGDELHLTVAHVHYQQDGQPRWGAASHLLATVQADAELQIQIETNERFHLPADGGADLIMIGPGTGVAPFRGFMQERAQVGASGRNWLFFGNPHFRSDFLYQLEWQRALKAGQLDRLDLAFSRDGGQRVHVQQRVRAAGNQLYAWLQGGAYLYVCGAIAMGKGVHAVLLDVIADNLGGDADAATEYLQRLQRGGRYARDVY